MREIITTVYSYDELNEKAKEKARDWYREGAFDYGWWDCTFEDFVRICNILGITVKGEGSKNLAVYFSGFYTQGSGASFAGSWEYQGNAVCQIREYAPTDTELHEIAEALHKIAARYEQSEGYEDDYPISANITQSGRYSHELSMRCDSDSGELDEDLLEQFRYLAQWLYSRLESEYEYLNSDEVVEESIRANEYEFDENGGIA